MSFRVNVSLLPLLVLGLFGCAAAEEGGGADYTGGTTGLPGTGSATGSGGASFGTGSAGPGTGGAALGTGGSGTATGGSATGGVASATGGAAAGGTGGTASSAVWEDFDSSLNGFTVTYENTTGAGTDAATFDASMGDPASGSAKIEIKAAGADQKVFFASVLASALNLSGKTITARVKLDSGLSSEESCPGGAYIYAKSGTGDGVFARGGWQNLSTSDGWVTLSFNLASPEYDDGISASDVREIGIAVSTGGACVANAGAYGPGVAHIDTVGF